MTTLIVAHYPCNDGFVASRTLAGNVLNPQIFDWNLRPETLPNLHGHAQVFFVDCCAPPEALAGLRNVTVIDHHETNLKATEGIQNARLIFSSTQCASELVYEFLELEKPWYIKHIADHDLWRYGKPECHPDSQAIVRALPKPLNLDELDAASDEWKAELVRRGEALLASDAEAIAAIVATSQPITVQLAGMWHLANWARLPPDFSEWRLLSRLGDVLAQNVAMALVIAPDDKVSCYSVRSQPQAISCADFCKQFGGGGHLTAAGCVLKDAYVYGLSGEFFRTHDA